jgi:release factor glutamine methyltransferase
VIETATIRRTLEAAGLVPLDAQVLLAHVLRRDRTWLAAHAADALPRDSSAAFLALAKRRRDGEPVAYLTGTREFWGLPLAVSPAVLIPRPETETVVEAALARLPSNRDVRVLDLGTGSGAIALAIARERPRARVLATDVSAAALDVARENARRLSLPNVEFLLADWYANVPAHAFDLIAANPPYVAERDPHLTEGDVRFEPQVALASGADGLDALRAVVSDAPGCLVDGGHLVVEHGHDQSDAVQELFRTAGFGRTVALRDLAGISRVVATSATG